MEPSDEDGPGARRRLEAAGWFGCLLAAAPPTAMLAALAQRFDEAPFAGFAPTLYIGLFTVMVLVMRHWTLR